MKTFGLFLILTVLSLNVASQTRINDSIRLTEKFRTQPIDRQSRLFRKKILPIYRKPNKEERKRLAPDAETEAKYKDFLKQKGTGLTKLIVDKECDKIYGVVQSTPHCLKYSMPGAGASYSFRYKNYRVWHLGDINYSGSSFRSLGVSTHGIYVNLSNVPLNDINLDSKGIEFLQKIVPSESIEDAELQLSKYKKGITNSDLTYISSTAANENVTYALRSIAYRGSSVKVVEGVAFNEFSLDKREDITVAFRIVKTVPGESVTILWKKLARKKSPLIKMNQKK